KRYFYSFWNSKNAQNPQQEWKDYLLEVKEVNRLFSNRLRKGYNTSRGRVQLQYGKPTMIEDRKMEPSLPPYQIWQYNTLRSDLTVPQSNKIFVFAEFNRSSNEYELIHSDAIGELYNRRWRYDLSQGYYGQGGSIDQNTLN